MSEAMTRTRPDRIVKSEADNFCHAHGTVVATVSTAARGRAWIRTQLQTRPDLVLTLYCGDRAIASSAAPHTLQEAQS